MQKKIIALAVAGLVSGGAFAQSNVSIYGIVDVGVEMGNSGYGSQTRIQSGQSAGNRLGFRGEESLGSGLTAYFQLEQGFLLDDGQGSSNGSATQGSGATTNGFATPTRARNNSGANVGQTNNGQYVFNRLSIAGLKGSWGSVQIGRQYSPTFAVRAAVDSSGLGTAASMATANPGTVDRLDNAILYTSPNMNGFTVGLGYSSGSENNLNATAASANCTNSAAAAATDSCTKDSGKGWGVLASYANGPVYVGLAHHRVKANGWTAAAAALGQNTDQNVRQWQLGGTYSFSAAKLHLLWGSHKASGGGMAHPANGDRAADAVGWAMGVTVPMGAHKFVVNYGQQNNKLAADTDFKFWGAHYEYALSKRTAFYAAYAKVNNDDKPANAGAGIAAGSALGTGLVVNNAAGSAGNYDPNALQFGMRHSF